MCLVVSQRLAWCDLASPLGDHASQRRISAPASHSANSPFTLQPQPACLRSLALSSIFFLFNHSYMSRMQKSINKKCSSRPLSSRTPGNSPHVFCRSLCKHEQLGPCSHHQGQHVTLTVQQLAFFTEPCILAMLSRST